ncbi:MAG: NfeD family protein [Actinomycetota bacterium]|nr:NfeD family protein [Actinomycetota bacterium]MDA8209401.1 NfeD family protein [Actinomycetota bacterium]
MLTLGAMLLILVVLAAFLVGLHGGPHASIVSAAVALVVAGVLLAVVLVRAASTGSLDLVAGAITAGAVVATASLLIFGLRSLGAARSVASRPIREQLWTRTGVALTDLAPMGAVRIAGETWSAEAAGGDAIKAGTEVVVVEVDGLHLKVSPDPLRQESH